LLRGAAGGRVEICLQVLRNAAEPLKRGFGFRLLEGSIKAERGGTSSLTYAPEGLRCEFLFPLEPATIETPPAADWAI
jgi:two-component sensor histidine kinase